MTSIVEEPQRIPANLWASLKDICYQQDLKFLQDVSRLIGVDANEIKRRVLGLREQTIVLVEKDPWWMHTQCILLECVNGLWRRCSRMGESNSYCWEHRNFTTCSGQLRRFDDPYFATIVKRWPIRFMDEIVWVCDEGTVLKSNGENDEHIRIDRITMIAHSVE
jgi:hypothetical protein